MTHPDQDPSAADPSVPAPAPLPPLAPLPPPAPLPASIAGSDPVALEQFGSQSAPVPATASDPVPATQSAPVPADPAPVFFAADQYWAVPPGYVVEPPRPARAWRGEAVAGLVAFIVVTGLGAGVGWLWEAIAPRLPVIKSAQGFLYASDEPEQPVGSDGYFVFIGLGVGILIALLAWVVLRRYRGAIVLVGLTLGSLAGATLAAWVGHKIGISQFKPVSAAAPIGAHLDAPLTLNMTSLDVNQLGRWPRLNGVVAAQAFAAAAMYTALSAFSAYADLGRHRSHHLPPPNLTPLNLGADVLPERSLAPRSSGEAGV